jgi:hypothetical protein
MSTSNLKDIWTTSDGESLSVSGTATKDWICEFSLHETNQYDADQILRISVGPKGLEYKPLSGGGFLTIGWKELLELLDCFDEEGNAY